MSYTELKIILLNEPVKIYQEYSNSWGGFAYIWESIWKKYLKRYEYDTWLNESNHERLWQSINDNSIPEWIRMLLITTFDYAIIEYEKLPLLVQYYKDFVELFPPEKKVCHLLGWRKNCLDIFENNNNINCTGICFYGTSVCDDYWMDYDLLKENKHWFVFEKYSKELGIK